MNRKIGKQSLIFENKPQFLSSAAIVGDVEGKGNLAEHFDLILDDDRWGEDSWEKSERKMFENAVKLAVQKAKLEISDIDCLLGGDLLNQIISANFAARSLEVPFLGLYSACSTMSESLLVGSMLIDGGYANKVACTASSHFSTAERQFRLPLEMGSQSTPTAQRTVTGTGCSILTNKDDENGMNVFITSATIGKVVDMGIADANNMGAAMAPAAMDTIVTHLDDTKTTLDDYDLVVTGDLGFHGSDLLYEICSEHGVPLSEKKHIDCGKIIFKAEQKFGCGASGCGCAATVLNSYLLKQIKAGVYRKILFMATGALLSTVSGMQGDTIPGIAHAVVIERGSRQ